MALKPSNNGLIPHTFVMKMTRVPHFYEENRTQNETETYALTQIVWCTAQVLPTLAMSSPLLPSGDLPEGLLLPDVIITRRTRTVSMSGRIDHNVIQEGTIRFFCRSKGHGFIDPIVKVGICSLYFGCPMVPFFNFLWILTSCTCRQPHNDACSELSVGGFHTPSAPRVRPHLGY